MQTGWDEDPQINSLEADLRLEHRSFLGNIGVGKLPLARR